jgi:hypothetical protein
MTIVTQFSWDDIADVDFTNPARKAFRQAVEEVAQKAREALPEANGRIDRAVKIVLQGDVELSDDRNSAKVASLSNGRTVYHMLNNSCECLDAKNKAPQGFCSHKLAYGIMKRSYVLAKERLAQLDAATNGTTTPTPDQPTTEALVSVPTQEPVAAPATPALPEAPASVNFHTTIAGRQIQITLRDTDETRLLARLEMLLQRFPVVEEPKEPAQQEGWCAEHNAKMKLHHGKKGTWWSHKLPNGQWCNRK